MIAEDARADVFAGRAGRHEQGQQIIFAAPTDTARGMFYDNLVFDPATLRHLIATFGETQVFAAAGYPFIAGQSHPRRPFAALDLPPTTLERLQWGNARRFSGLL